MDVEVESIWSGVIFIAVLARKSDLLLDVLPVLLVFLAVLPDAFLQLEHILLYYPILT